VVLSVSLWEIRCKSLGSAYSIGALMTLCRRRAAPATPPPTDRDYLQENNMTSTSKQPPREPAHVATILLCGVTSLCPSSTPGPSRRGLSCGSALQEHLVLPWSGWGQELLTAGGSRNMIVQGVSMAPAVDTCCCETALSQDSIYGPDKGGRDLRHPLLGRS
jgi:hypothetical protein